MDLTIVVVSFNTRELLRRCLSSIAETVHTLDYEVFVVDNASTDGSAEMVAEEFPQVRLIRNGENVGFARANNQAIALSRGRHVLLLNSDAVLLDGTAERMVALLDAQPNAGAVGGMLLSPDGSFQSSYNDFPGLLQEVLLVTGVSRWLLPPTYPSYPEDQSRELRPVDWVGGALLMARRDTIDAIGPLDEDYFMYVEEMDWCFRMQRAGWQVFFLPEARAVHVSGASARHVPERKRAQLYRSKWLFQRKHRGRLCAGAFRVLVRVASTLKLLGWAATSVSRDPARREHARRQMASYRYLLANF